MKLSYENIDKIRGSFAQMQNRSDFVNLLNIVKPLIYGYNCKPFKLGQIIYYARNEKDSAFYTRFDISKKSGAKRSIHAPTNGLKAIQKTLALILQCVFDPHPAAQGFTKGRSIVDNAKKHVGKNYVFNVDLKDFFHSIDQSRFWKCMQLQPFNLYQDDTNRDQKYIPWERFLELTGENIDLRKSSQKLANGLWAIKSDDGFICYAKKNIDFNKELFLFKSTNNQQSRLGQGVGNSLWLVNKIPVAGRIDLAGLIASLCCFELEVERKDVHGNWQFVKKKVLPQGAPTSPVITNIVCQRLDYLLTGVAKRFHATYTRYADDITFSSNHNLYQQGSEFIEELYRIIDDQNFQIKDSKTRLQKEGFRKEVTGLLVNDKVNVQQRYIKQLRMWLYYWERYGYDKATRFFLQQYSIDKGHVKNGKPDLAKVICGKLDFLKMVKGEDNDSFKKLKFRFELLSGKDEYKLQRRDYLNGIIHVIFERGLDDAMGIYKAKNI